MQEVQDAQCWGQTNLWVDSFLVISDDLCIICIDLLHGGRNVLNNVEHVCLSVWRAGCCCPSLSEFVRGAAVQSLIHLERKVWRQGIKNSSNYLKLLHLPKAIDVIPFNCRHLSCRKSHPLTSHRAVCSATATGCNRLTEVGNVCPFILPVQWSSG